MHLEGLRVVGLPEVLARKYCEMGIDELIFIDTVASLYGRNSSLSVVERTAEASFIPMTVGGGIRTLADVNDALRSGADKVTINSGAVRRPELITDIARAFGSQCAVVAIEAQRSGPDKWAVLIDNAREPTGLDALEWARRAYDCGAGEILLTSIDRDGTRKGCDLKLTRTVAEAVPIPVVASGGPGTVQHVVDALADGLADAIALGTLLHFNLATVAEIKTALLGAGVPVRPVATAAA